MTESKKNSRRNFVRNASLFTVAGLASGLDFSFGKPTNNSQIKLGLVTYLWGKDWDVPTLIKNCTAAQISGVELRVEHAHGVEPSISNEKRKEVKKMFNDSPVKIVGMGTNQQYDYLEPEKLSASIEITKEFIKLSHDIGGSGVKVKPNAFHKEVPHEKTIEQIGKALNELGKFAADYGQKIRLEVHGNETQELPNIKSIMEYASNPEVCVCWNCNDEDLIGGGLEYNFNLVRNRIGDTTHVRELNIGSYPYQDLMNLFVKMNYKGWILLECRTDPADKVKALIEQREVFEKMIKIAQG
jgi:sugar phosphate isomerase/epimerase